MGVPSERDRAVVRLGPSPQAAVKSRMEARRRNLRQFEVLWILPSIAVTVLVVVVGALLDPLRLPASLHWVGGLVVLLTFISTMVVGEHFVWPLVVRRQRQREEGSLTTGFLNAVEIVTGSSSEPMLTIELRGRVVMGESIRAPITGTPCVAFGLWGQGSYGPIADAHAVCFELATDEHGLVLVRPDSADVRFEGRTAPRRVVPNPELVAFLEARGTFPKIGDLFVAEGQIVDGDMVLVEGIEDEQTEGVGYRERATRIVLRGSPSQPVIVTKLNATGQTASSGST